jgi:hypothetical protein
MIASGCARVTSTLCYHFCNIILLLSGKIFPRPQTSHQLTKAILFLPCPHYICSLQSFPTSLRTMSYGLSLLFCHILSCSHPGDFNSYISCQSICHIQIFFPSLLFTFFQQPTPIILS